MADMRREGWSLPFQPKVSAVYQRFTSPEEGVVQNIIQVGFDNRLTKLVCLQYTAVLLYTHCNCTCYFLYMDAVHTSALAARKQHHWSCIHVCHKEKFDARRNKS